MKKSKILAISLGAVALTTVAVATPVILTSCGDDAIITNVLFKDGVVVVDNSNNEGYRLTRDKNDFTVTVPKGTTWDALINSKAIEISQNPFDYAGKEKLISLGFNKTAIEQMLDENIQEPIVNKYLMVSYGVVDKNGKTRYLEFEKNIDEKDFELTGEITEAKKVANTITIYQIDDSKDTNGPGFNPEAVEFHKTFSFSLTIAPAK